MSIENAVAAYKVLEEAFSRQDLSGGNCGAAALAVAYRLQDLGVDCSLGFVTCDEAEAPSDISEGELPLYHVTVVIDDCHIDGDGSNGEADIREWVRLEYRDSNCVIFTGLQLDDRMVIRAIDWDTDWSINAATFYDALKGADLDTIVTASQAPRPGG